MAVFVREVMTPGVVSVRPDASLVEAAQLMRAQDIGDVLVAGDHALIGVLTDRDIALRGVRQGVHAGSVGAVGLWPPVAVVGGPAVGGGGGGRVLGAHAVRRLPVVVEGRAVGMVSLGDLAISENPDSALAEISRATPDGRGGVARA
ncbi:CBS domain-containing protein [Streptomyces sp. NPDC058656]|uniref:CBS domain-containing protein n=1 Tax=Streptomyces sp. NPDC058656 TaxID=3346578 RepID=UPI003666FB08